MRERFMRNNFSLEENALWSENLQIQPRSGDQINERNLSTDRRA